jgi:hypothetical protein
MSRSLPRFVMIASLLAGGAAFAQGTPAPGSVAVKATIKPINFQLDKIAELKAAHDKVAAAAAAVKKNAGQGKDAFRGSVTLLLAADKARVAGDLDTAKALGSEAGVMADLALKGNGAVPTLDSLKQKNPKFGGFINTANPLVPAADQLGHDPEGWSTVGIAPANVD